PFEVGMSHYDDPPPDELPDLDEFVAGDRARFVNELSAWIEVDNGIVVDHGHAGRGLIGVTTLRLGGRGMAFQAVSFPDRRKPELLDTAAVGVQQTCGGGAGGL